MIRTPRDRWFEVACATDPRLFHTDYAGHRNAGNFYSSRATGVLGNARGDTTWMMPPQALRRFAGAQRLYYALATYGGRNGEDPRFTITPVALERVPSISIGPDFSGRSLDRRRVGGDTGPAYGSRAGEPLRWGGDAVLESERRSARTITQAQSSGYDDGYDPQLWGSGSDEEEDYADDESVPESMGLGDGSDDYEDGPASYGFVGRGRDCGCGSPTRTSTARRVSARPVGAASFGTGSTDLDVGADEYEDGAEYHRRNPDGPVAPGEPEPMRTAPVAQPQAWQHGRGFADDDLEDGVDYHSREGVGQSFGAPMRTRP
ncbi:MAG TPA: hypothetical protein VG755_45540, partial [Nannocystaceae bacterium]|nr:hypothetical protein [Nannocystaceae bacterium]